MLHLIVRATRDNIIPVRHSPTHQGVYSHHCSQEEEETLQIPIMQCVWVEVTWNIIVVIKQGKNLVLLNHKSQSV